MFFDNVDYVSFVNAGTYGPPPIIAPGKDHVSGEMNVLYVNTGAVIAIQVDKVEE